MYHTLSFSVAKLANHFSRLSQRLKSSGKRPSAPLGARILTNPDDIFKHNMWDHVRWTDEDKENARQKVEENSYVKIPLPEQGKFTTEAFSYWDQFYETHQNKFFKDRKWLFLEFPELLPPGAKCQITDTCLNDHQMPSTHSAGSSLNTESRQQQNKNCTNQDRTEASNHQGACHGTAVEEDQMDFPGQDASFRILEVCKTLQMH